MAAMSSAWQATQGKRWMLVALALFAFASVGWAYATSEPKVVLVVHEISERWDEGPDRLQGADGIGVMPAGYVRTTHDLWKGFDENGRLVKAAGHTYGNDGSLIGESKLSSDGKTVIGYTIHDDGSREDWSYEMDTNIGLDNARDLVVSMLGRGAWHLDGDIVYEGRQAHLYKLDHEESNLSPSFSALIVDAMTNRMMFTGLYIRDGKLRFGTRGLLYDVTSDPAAIPDSVWQLDL